MIVASYTRRQIKFGEALPLAEQNESIDRFTKEHRMRISKRYSDRSEKLESETGFLEMKEDGLNHRFDCVVFCSMMYFGKDPLVGYNLLLHAFLPIGIDFAIVSDDFISVGKSTEEIRAFLKEKYQERRMAHLYNTVAIARAARMNTLYGYKVIDGKYTIDEAVKPVVEEVFSSALNGMTVQQICKDLERRGVEPPQIYLRRCAGKCTEGISGEWKSSSVRKILTDSRYKGIGKVMVDGQPFEEAYPAYVDDATYERIAASLPTKKCSARWENPINKKVFDKDTLCLMHANNYRGDGKKYYHPSVRTEEVLNYPQKCIQVETVLSEAEAAMNQEHQIAIRVRDKLESEEGPIEFARRTASYTKDIHRVFEKLLYAESASDDSVLPELDKQFTELYGIINQYKTAFSLNNPWLQTYLAMSEHEPLDLKNGRKYIGRILVHKNETVEFEPLFAEVKSLLPEEWLNPEVEYGKKE